MAAAPRLTSPDQSRPQPRLQHQALDLSRTLPRLAIEARRVASGVVHGLHGRRASGVGENFWQFRHFTVGEAAARVDWRRSARDDHLYVREREWEAAHTAWLWADRSASMGYVSDLAQASKAERALVLLLALADMMVRGGERAGLIGAMRPTSNRDVVSRCVEALTIDPGAGRDLPEPVPLGPHTEAVLIGDFLGPAEETAKTVAALAARGARGHLVMVCDPVEETFPFTGRTELVDPQGGGRLTVGQVQSLRGSYATRLAAHRDALREGVKRVGWTLTLHRTDRPASQALLALHPLLMAIGGAR